MLSRTGAGLRVSLGGIKMSVRLSQLVMNTTAPVVTWLWMATGPWKISTLAIAAALYTP